MSEIVSGSPASLDSLKAIWRTPYRGSEWPMRFLIGTLLLFSGYLIPVLPWIFVAGYGIRVMRMSIEDDRLELPPWDNWGGLAWDGLRAIIITLIFLLPGIIVLFGGMGQYFLTIFTMPALGVALEDGGSGPGLFMLAILGSFAIFFLAMGIGNLLLILGSLPLPVVTAHFAATQRFRAIIQIGFWFRLLWRNMLGYLLAWILAFGVIGLLYFFFFFGYFLIVPLCLVPILGPPILFFITVVTQTLFGLTYRDGLKLMD